MIKAMTTIFALAALSFNLPALAQSSASDKPSTVQKDTLNTAKPDPGSDVSPQKNTAPKDLDSFFKEGERQAKEGPMCEKKPEPVA